MIHLRSRLAARLFAAALLASAAATVSASDSASTSPDQAQAAQPQAGQTKSDGLGIIVIAHGANPTWNMPVTNAVARVSQTIPAERAFLMGTPDQTPQQAYDKLVAGGAKRIVVVPLFVSSYSGHAEQVKFIGGQRADYPHAEHMKLTQVKGAVPIVGVGRGMDDHAIVGDIIADRAKALSTDAKNEWLMIVAHGPNEDEEAKQWNAAITNVGSRVRTKLPFKGVDVRLLRDDAPKDVKDKALAEMRASVEEKSKTSKVVVVPLLLSTGRVGGQIPEVLKGLTFAWDGKPLLPDDRIADWIVDEARRADKAPAGSQ
jgi:sirohydrochlorin cobaltochelatase